MSTTQGIVGGEECTIQHFLSTYAHGSGVSEAVQILMDRSEHGKRIVEQRWREQWWANFRQFPEAERGERAPILLGTMQRELMDLTKTTSNAEKAEAKAPHSQARAVHRTSPHPTRGASRSNRTPVPGRGPSPSSP